MRMQYSFSYMPCQTCTAKVHCDQCQDEIARRLLEIDGVAGAEVNIPQRMILIDAQGADPDEIDDEMDAIGVFLG